MPVAQSERISSRPGKLGADAASSSTKLRTITQAETKYWGEALKDPSIIDYEFLDLDEPFEYPFKDQDTVWVRTKEDNWCIGRVSGRSIRSGQTHLQKHGFYYPVNFGVKSNIRKYFAPLNGEIKPNSEEVRKFLRYGGWLDDDSDSGDALLESGHVSMVDFPSRL